MANKKKPAAERQSKYVRVMMKPAEKLRADRIAKAAGSPAGPLMLKWFFDRADVEKLG